MNAPATVTPSLMSERMVVYLGENLDWIELNGMPAFIGSGTLSLDAFPRRFTDGQGVLVWSQRANDRFVYLGQLHGARVRRHGENRVALDFSEFERFARPVLICEGENDLRDRFYDASKGFLHQFSYVPDDAFQRVLENSKRSAPTRT